MSGKRILIIDDEENIRRVTRLTLEAAGYEVSEAGDGEKGLELFGDGSGWDAVLLDQRMPGMDGLETLRLIKGRAPGARVIMVTAYASIELAVEAMKLGSSDFVRKPMTPEIVRDAVAAALAKSSSPFPAASVREEERETPLRALVEYVTMNGFSYVDAPEAEDSQPSAPNERRFLVKNPRGLEKEVVVEIDPEAVGYVERMTRRKLPPSSSFWTVQASNLLSTFLWNEGRLPDSRLALRNVDRDDLPVAERWRDFSSLPFKTDRGSL
jgi:DNA-binding response OmpR family regulator